MKRVNEVWYDNVGVLVDPDFALEFWPAPYHTASQRTNAMVRLAVYACVGAWILSGKKEYLLVGLAVIVVISVAHRNSVPHAGVAERTAMDVAHSATPSINAVAHVPTAGEGECTMPTEDNPFANILVTELTQTPPKPPPCPFDTVEDKAIEFFNRGLPRDMYDVFGTQNSQRQFYQVPQRDTKKFMDFVYGSTARICKEDSKYCTGRW
jgi:hypothetical protein